MPEETKRGLFGKRDWIAALAVGGAALVLYALNLAGYVYPGESAHLAAVWGGLDKAPFDMYPLAHAFSGLFGRFAPPVFGALAASAIYLVATALVRSRIGGDEAPKHVSSAALVAGLVSSVTFMLAPAVESAATHLEPRMFAAVWALLAFLLIFASASAPKWLAWTLVVASGAVSGMGLADSPAFLMLLPLQFAAAWSASKASGGRGYGAAAVVVLVFIAAFFAYAPSATGAFGEYVKFQSAAVKAYFAPSGWLFIPVFATIPFVVSLLSGISAYRDPGSWTQWLFHLAMTLIAVLAVATPLSPSSVARECGNLPVFTSAFAALVAAYVAAYWWIEARSVARVNESLDAAPSQTGRVIAYVAGSVLAVALVFSALINLFSFDSASGGFADKVAEKILDDMGDRTWLVTDGSLDDHLRFAADRKGKELNLVCLQRDLDKSYLVDLGALVKEKGIGGEKSNELAISLSLGVLTFVQDWLADDPEAAKSVAIFGAPDLWHAAKLKPVPEFAFFGSDPSREPDWSAWKKFGEILSAPKGWGSYRLWKNEDPVEKMKFDLRRHFGLVATDRGVWLQDEGRDDEAFAMYELVLNDIDADNVSALFNEFEMARVKHPKALQKSSELERRLKAIADDADRRYRLWGLANYYGYIRSPEIFVRLGYQWARSGRPGEALHQIRRAIDFVPAENKTTLITMMAALYASGDERAKSREMYESVLSKDAENHDALIGLMRLELMDGNGDKALEYLEKAVAKAGDTVSARLETAMFHMMKGEQGAAAAELRKVTDADVSNLQAWSMLAAVTIQQIDAASDKAEKAKLTKYLEDVILATMEKQARSASDYYLQTTRAFVLLRKGDEKRREARDALVAAMRDRPDVAATSDMILGLDISLNDVEDAERQAREVLRRNRKAPLANYVMGSIALQNGRYMEAETFLRRAVASERPVVLALNDLAEVLRRNRNFSEAEAFARKAVESAPDLYVAWETLGSTLMDAGGDLNEAEKCINKACELSKGKDGHEADVRMLVSLARVQLARGDKMRAKGTLRKVLSRSGELSDFERGEFDKLRTSVK